jgi:sarcosine oxidase, subunit alpha
VQGPRARETIAPFVEGLDLSNDALPHMSVREARISGVLTRLMRVSFTGELGYEINVPSHFGPAIWEAAWREVQKQGGCAYGTEAMHVMRAEKGYVIVGQETDGTVTLADLGLDWAIGKSKKDFVGKRSLTRPDILAANRKQLVGLLTDNPAIQLEEGAQVTEGASPPIGSSALGHVTSSYRSEAAGRPIALALVAAGRSRIGAKVHVPMPGGAVQVTVTAPVFYDKPGARLNV